MKFLSPNLEGKNLMFLNIFYSEGTKYDYTAKDDILDIIFKDLDTGQQFVETIKNPYIEVWIRKPEHRNYSQLIENSEKSLCTPHKVHYKSRYSEVAKLLNIKPQDAKYSPYVFQLDVDICQFYTLQFMVEYQTKEIPKLSMGYLDIEVDSIAITGFPDGGQCPVNMISYLDASRMQMYTLFLTCDNVPSVNIGHPKYELYNSIREKFRTQCNALEADIDNIIKELEKDNFERYGNIQYNVLFFDDELSLIQTIFEILEKSMNDYVGIWNAPFDVGYLKKRLEYMGYRPESVICSPIFGENRSIYFYEDRNTIAHKRKHVFQMNTLYTFIDLMVNYSGIHSGRGKIPSLKLNAVAKNEIKDSKLDYTEEGNFRMFPYLNLRKFFLYNIKDTLLLLGIDQKTNDTNTVYARVYMDAVPPKEAFVSTAFVGQSYRKYLWEECDVVVGSNRNILYPPKDLDELLAEAYDPDDIDDDDDDEAFDDDSDSKKKKKFQGAFVMNTKHLSPSGFKILGTDSKYVHRFVGDQDITSEYPTAICIMNSSNDTLSGKVVLVDESVLNVPFYQNMYFVNKDDEENYRFNVSNWMMEILAQDDSINFGHMILNLPSIEELVEIIEDRKVELIS